MIVGDALDQLRRLPAESVHCCVTSPPYYGLRDYGTAQWQGGEQNCSHSIGGQVQDNKAPRAIVSGVRPGVDASRCRICGATRIDSQIGLEATPDAYIAALVAVFREVRRVLRKDGTLWLNIGDSYNTRQARRSRNFGDTKPKDLIGIPWMLAFALRADGWWLRQDIIWSKPNPMPESVTDRCTKAHEYLFLLSKSERYYYDAAAIAEPAVKAGQVLHSYGTAAKDRQDVSETNDRRTRIGLADWNQACPETRNKRSVWTVATNPYAEAHFATFPVGLIDSCILAGCPRGGAVLDPFGGAGTAGLVADRLGRDAILIELNPLYADMSERRIYRDGPLFADVAIDTMEIPDVAE
jgi:DNA modification methylase